MHEVTRILAALVGRSSATPPGSTAEVCEYIADKLRAAGCAVGVHARRAGVDNVVAVLGQGAPVLAFNCHVDTVAPGAGWHTDPLGLNETAPGRYAGLGAVNCKGAAATHLWLALALATAGGPARGSVVFSFVGDEETLGPDGTRFLAERGLIKPDMLVMAAPTSNTLMVEERGVLWLRLETGGRAAHAGDPAAGDSAILRMTRLLARLDAELGARLAGRREGAHQSTLNIGTLAGGSHTNVVADACVATLDRRLLPRGESIDAAQAEIEAILAAAGEPAGSWSLTRITGTNGFRMAPTQPLVRAFAAAVEAGSGRAAEFRVPVGASDARFLSDSGAQIVIFGPGDDREGHAANESIAEAELVESCAIQHAVVRELLGVAA